MIAYICNDSRVAATKENLKQSPLGVATATAKPRGFLFMVISKKFYDGGGNELECYINPVRRVFVIEAKNGFLEEPISIDFELSELSELLNSVNNSYTYLLNQEDQC